ncbi:MAG: type II secretion system F family protein [Desulfatibacillaceae bacterium]
MPKFSYNAITQAGTNITGTMDAETREQAMEMLGSRGYIPTRVKPARGEKGKGPGLHFGGVRTRDLILFTKQFATMLRAGLSILELLRVLEEQTENPKLRQVVAKMTSDIREGEGLHEAMGKHPRVFPPLYLSMIRAGERSGALPDVLDRLIYITSHEAKVKSDIKGALTYPAIVVFALVIAFFVLLTFVVPKFVRIFESAGIDLPLPTVICFQLYRFLSDYWYLAGGALILAVVAVVMWFRTEQGAYLRDRFLMKVPFLGPLFQKAAMSRFASIFAILQSSGVTVLESMRILSGTIGNAAIAREFDSLRTSLEEGRGISAPLRQARYFTPMTVNMISIGEESGNLDDMLRDVSTHYDEEVEFAVGRMSEAITPVLTIGLAAVVGFFALAIFLPMWDLAKVVK